MTFCYLHESALLSCCTSYYSARLFQLKGLLHCAIWSATCNATLKNVFVAVAEVGCYTVQRNLSNLQWFVPRKPCDIRCCWTGVSGRSDLQRNQRMLGENCIESCWRGVTLCNGSCKLLRLLQKVELDSTSCNVARNEKKMRCKLPRYPVTLRNSSATCNAMVLRCKLL